MPPIFEKPSRMLGGKFSMTTRSPKVRKQYNTERNIDLDADKVVRRANLPFVDF